MSNPTVEEFDQFLKDHHLSASGLRGGGAGRSGPPPTPRFADAHWKWADIRAALVSAAELVTVGPTGMTEMRTVHGTGGPHHANTMSAQILNPGERTRAHRNMKNETRLVREAPAGAIFVCDGEAFPMGRGDVIISPTWTFHESYNPEGNTDPAIWIDGFDRGYSSIGEEAEALGMNERYSEDEPFQRIERSDGYALKTLGHVRQLSDETPYPLPPMSYPWAETWAALTALRESEVEGDPYDGLHVTLVSPVDGGPTLPTMSWHAQLARSREKTQAHPHNSTTCYHVFEGAGATVIEGERLEWSEGDIFVIPPWRWHQHENSSSSDAVLFSIDDAPAMTKLGFYRKQEATA